MIVGTPIGDYDDLSPRARAALTAASLIACEERREGLRLLRHLGIQAPILEINEHTEQSEAESVVDAMAAGEVVALISDCGMPLVADPGSLVLSLTLARGISVTAIPGPTSITTALALCDFDTSRFYFYGFLSAKRELRQSALTGLRGFPDPLVFLDAPYRLLPVLEDLKVILGATRRVCVACDLTLPGEIVLRGTLSEVHGQVAASPRKCEYVIIVEGAKSSGRIKRR